MISLAWAAVFSIELSCLDKTCCNFMRVRAGRTFNYAGIFKKTNQRKNNTENLFSSLVGFTHFLATHTLLPTPSNGGLDRSVTSNVTPYFGMSAAIEPLDRLT